MLRRIKREVVPELPPRTDTVLHVELDEAERSVYDAVRVATKQERGREARRTGGGVLAALEALLRLRQAACHAGARARAAAPRRRRRSSGSLEALEDAVADGHKALVFSQWTSLLDLRRAAPARRPASRFTRLDGSTRDRGGGRRASSRTTPARP